MTEPVFVRRDGPMNKRSGSPGLGGMNKNWNDRADRDLFFTILSVKNIGVISGAEWTTIGNTLRSLGYGFTNEGCRQHFQGLRRAQQKLDGGSPGSDGNRRVDPTLNPITRRPGPGRGRPKKQEDNSNSNSIVQFEQSPLPMPMPLSSPSHVVSMMHYQPALGHPGPPQHLQPLLETGTMPRQMLEPDNMQHVSKRQEMDGQPMGGQSIMDGQSVMGGHSIVGGQSVMDNQAVMGGQSVMSGSPHQLDDESVLALAAHGHSVPVEAFPTDPSLSFHYSEA